MSALNGNAATEVNGFMGPILYRYIILEQLIPLGVCIFGLIVVFLTGRMMQLMQILIGSNVTFLDFLELILLTLPMLMLFALPMATLIGILMGFLRLTSDNELMVMRSSGIKFGQFLSPVLSVALLTTGISLVSAIHIMPRTNTLFRTKLNSLGRAAIPALLKERTFISSIPGMTLFFQSVEPTQLRLQGVYVQDDRDKRVQSTIVAESGHIVYQEVRDLLVIKITNGIITRIQEDFKNAQTVSFQEYELSFAMDELTNRGPAKIRHRNEMSFWELREESRKAKNIASGDAAWLAMQLHQILAIPFACAALGLLAPPLGSRFRQANRIVAVFVGISLFLGYYVLLSAGKGLIKNGLLAPSIGIWTPNLVTLSLALALWVQAQREKPFRILSRFPRACQRIIQKCFALFTRNSAP
jgi:lipopolysaccharide export system permease protein